MIYYIADHMIYYIAPHMIYYIADHMIYYIAAHMITSCRYGEALETFRKTQQGKLLIYGALYGIVSFGVFVFAGITYW